MVEKLFGLQPGGWMRRTGAAFYDSLKDSGNRRPIPPARVRQNDRKMSGADRRSLNAKMQELSDNFAIASWMIRMHVDYIASLRFKSDSGNAQVDEQVDKFVEGWSTRYQCHAQRRFPLRKLIRLIETSRVAYGDVFMLKIAGSTPLRGSIQIIEPDRVADPPNLKDNAAAAPTTKEPDPSRWFGGVQVSRTGIPTHYGVHRRTPQGDLVWERAVAAQNMIAHGFYDRVDGYRGVSPLQVAANQLSDVYEGIDYSLKKVKVAQALAAVITRDAEMGLGAVPTADGDGDGIPDRDFEWDLSKGPQIFDLLPGEGVEMIQGSSDSTDSIALLRMMVQVALKALDLPMSFFSEDFTNWFGQRASHMHFEKSARPKREELKDALNELMQWRLGMAVGSGAIVLPNNFGFEDLHWEWVAESTGWFDPLKEAQGYRALISAGLDSPIDICKANGKDWEKVLADRKLFEDRAEELDLSIDYAMGSSSSSNVQPPATEEEEEPAVVGAADDEDETEEEEEEDE